LIHFYKRQESFLHLLKDFQFMIDQRM